MEEQLFMPMGMRKDFNKELTTQEDSQYLYDAHNIRVITRGDETTGSIINEKGTQLASDVIQGAYMGHATINDKVIVFTHNDAYDVVNRPNKDPEYINKQGIDDSHRFYTWKLSGLAAKTFSGTITLSIVEDDEDGNIKTLWRKILTKEEVLSTFLNQEVIFNVGILECNWHYIQFGVVLSDYKYENLSTNVVENKDKWTVDVESPINYKAGYTEMNVPIIINNNTTNNWEQFFSGGKIILTRQNFNPIYKDIQLSPDHTKPTIYWFDDLEVAGYGDLEVDVILDPPGSNFLIRELILLGNDSSYGVMCNVVTNPGIEIKDEDKDYQIKDRIYLVENTEGTSVNVTKLFEGNLNFSFDYPIEAVSYYEGVNIQKVYWTDGLNPTRVINIARTIDPTDQTQFDFVPTLKLEETVQINKVDAASEGRAPGVIQYIFTYVNKFLQESNPFFVSSLYYTSFADRAGSPEDVVYSAFKLEINNPDKRFDYVKVYVIERTSLNGTPIINSLPLLEIGNSSSVSVIDSGVNYISEDSDILYPSHSVAADTINIKDYALFLGGIKKIYNEQDYRIANVLSDYVYNIRERILLKSSELKKKITTEKFQLDYSSEEITVFKDLNTYRLGIQFQFKDGSFSQPYFLKDVEKSRDEYTEEEIRSIFWASLNLTIGITDNIDIYDSVIGIRPLIVYPKDSQKKALYQGVLNPTVFNAKDRNENAPFTQPSWFFRPFRTAGVTAAPAKVAARAVSAYSGKIYYMYFNKGTAKYYFKSSEGITKLNSIINGNLEIKHVDGWTLATAKVSGVSCGVARSGGNLYSLCLFLTNLTNPESVVSLSYSKYRVYINGEECLFRSSGSGTYIIEGKTISGLDYIPLDELGLINWNKTRPTDTSGKVLNKGVFTNHDLIAYPSNFNNPSFNSTVELINTGTRIDDYCNFHVGNTAKNSSVAYLKVRDNVVYWGDDEGKTDVQDYWYNVYDGAAGTYSIPYFKHPDTPDTPIDPTQPTEGHDPDLDEGSNFFREYKHMYQIPLANTYKGEIQGSIKKTSLADVSVNNNFFIDASLVTFHSPDCELENIYDNQDYTLNLIGAYRLIKINEKLDIAISSSMLEQSKSGFTPPGAALIKDTSFIAKPCWYDGVFHQYYGGDSSKDPFAGTAVSDKWPGYIIYPWQKTGSLNNQNTTETADGLYKELSSVLRTKITYHSLDFSDFKYIAFADSWKINYKVCLKENLGMDAIQSGYLDDPIAYYKHIDTVLTPAGQSITLADGTKYSGYPIYVGTETNENWLYSTENLKDSYYPNFFSINSLLPSVGSTGYRFSANPVSMKYKSGNHLFISLNRSKVNYPSTLPFYTKATKDYTFYNQGVPYNKGFNIRRIPQIEEAGDYLLCGEICNTNPDSLSSNDTKSETWFIGGKISPIKKVLFTDPERDQLCLIYTPNGIEWTEGDYFYQKYECLKTSSYTLEDENQIVEIAKFPCQCQVNLDGRYDRNKNTSFNVNLTPDNFNLINPVYSQKNNLFIYRRIDSEQFNNGNLNNSITWSLNKANNAIEDKWLRTTLMSSINVSGDCGKISAIKKDEENNLVVFQDTGIAVILYNNQTLQATDLAPIELVNNNKVNGLKYISSTIGCSNKWAIQPSEFGIIFADSKTKTLWKLNNGKCVDLSLTSGMKSWFLKHSNDKAWSHKVYKNFKISYDIVNKDFYLINVDSCLCYNGEVAISFYDYEDTPALFSLHNKYYCFKSAAQETEGKYITEVHSMFTGEYNKFFGVFKDSSMTYLANKNPTRDKTFTNFEYRCDMYDVEANTTLPMTHETFSTIRAYNEYQDSGDIVLTPGIVKMDNIRKKFRIWRGLIPRDFNGRDRIRNPWMYLTITKKFTKNIKFELHDMVIKSI